MVNGLNSTTPTLVALLFGMSSFMLGYTTMKIRHEKILNNIKK